MQIYCARHQNLIFVKNLKCAGSMFYQNLISTFGWEPIQYNDIDWLQDRVIAHIMDPMERRLKGLVTMLKVRGLLEDYIDNRDHLSILKYSFALDPHTINYTDFFGKNIDKIDFLPLSRNRADNIEMFVNHVNHMLEKSHLSLENWNQAYTNTGTKLQHLAYQLLLQDLDCGMMQEAKTISNDATYRSYLDQAAWRLFYRGARRKHWPECDTFENFYALPSPIKKEIKRVCEDQHIKMSKGQLKFNYANLVAMTSFSMRIMLDYYRDDVIRYQTISNRLS